MEEYYQKKYGIDINQLKTVDDYSFAIIGNIANGNYETGNNLHTDTAILIAHYKHPKHAYIMFSEKEAADV